MIWWQALALLFGLLTLLLLVGLPAGFAFLAINLVGALVWFGGEAGLVQVVRNGVASVTNFSLTPIPFFILMGEVLFHTGLAMKAIDGFDHVIRGVPGRLAVVAIVAGTVFSAISGSTIATTALLGSLLLPEMLRRGYHPRMAMGPIMAIGGVDMLIPPSALTVLLGSLAGISISGLLIAGVVPGFLMAAMFIGYIVISAKRKPELAPSFEREEAHGWQRWRPLVVNVTPLVLIFVLVIVAMSAGWATPTESAALGALATVVVCVLYRSLSWKAMVDALAGTAAISGVILFIIIGATTFSQILSFSGATNGMVSMIQGAGLSGWAVLAGMIADAAVPRLLRRSGQHDADHAAVLHAAGAALRLGPAVVRRRVPDLHAARLADAAVRHAAVHDAQRGAEVDRHQRDLRVDHAVRADGSRDDRAGACGAAAGDLVSGIAAREVAIVVPAE